MPSSIIEKLQPSVEEVTIKGAYEDGPDRANVVLDLSINSSRLPRTQGEDTITKLVEGLTKELGLQPGKVRYLQVEDGVYDQLMLECKPDQIRRILPQFQEPLLARYDARQQKSL